MRRRAAASAQHGAASEHRHPQAKAAGLRRAVERHSAGPLFVLHRLPRWLVPVAMATLFLVGALVPGPVGVAATVVVLVFLGWLSYVSWPTVTGRGRMRRVLMLGLITGLLVTQLVLG